MHLSRRLFSFLTACAVGAMFAPQVLEEPRLARALANTDSVYVSGRINQVHVVNAGDNTVSSRIVMNSAAGAQFNGVDANSTGTIVYHTNLGSSTVSVIDTLTDTITATVPVMGDPRSVLVSPDDAHYYVSNLGGTIYKMRASDNTRVLTITAGAGTYGMGISNDGAFLYVPNNGSNTVSKSNFLGSGSLAMKKL